MYEDSYLYRPSIATHDQNQEHDTWTHLIDLVRDSYLALASADRVRADNLLRRWVLSKRALFRRLALHALAENPKSDIQLARTLLVAGRAPGVWEFDLRREVLRIFRKAGRRLPRSLRAEIVEAIHAGPKSGRGKTRPNYAKIIRREKAVRLQKLAASGARLDRKSRTLADEAEGGQGPDERDEFAEWHGEGVWVGDADFAPKNLLEGSLSEVEMVLENDEIGHDAFRGFTLLQPVKAASGLRRLARRGKWPASAWQGFLWGFGGLSEKPGLERRMRAYAARILAGAPDELFADVESAAADFVKDLAEQCGIERERELSALWMKAWGGIGGRVAEVIEIDDVLTRALNDAAGKLSEAALVRLWKYELAPGSGVPSAVRAYFDAIAGDPDGQLGRVILATRLHQLFAIDPDWSREHLIARLSPGNSEEAGPLWSAYGWSASVGPDLLRAFKDSLLEVLCDGRDLGRGGERLTTLFMTICLEAPDELTKQEIGRVVGSMSERSLKTSVRSLQNRLTGNQDDRAQIWRARIAPWLREYWPRLADRNTSGTSLAILELLLECGDAFPEAVVWALPYLRPLEGRGLVGIGRNEQVKRHPEAMLDVLDRVSVENILPPHQRYSLRQALDAVVEAEPTVKGDARFQRLYRLATQ